MLNLAFKESGSSLDDIISALIVDLEKLRGQPFDRQASEDQPVAGKSRLRERVEPRLHQQRPHPGREALTASRIEQSIVDAGLKRPRHRRDQRRGRHGKDRRLPRSASGGPGPVESDAEASAGIESLADSWPGFARPPVLKLQGAAKVPGPLRLCQGQFDPRHCENHDLEETHVDEGERSKS
jgi:hypothetical protein